MLFPRSQKPRESTLFTTVFSAGVPEELLQQPQPARAAGEAGGDNPGPLHLSHRSGGGGDGICPPVLAGGHGAAPGQRRGGPARLQQRSVSHGASLGTNLLQMGCPSQPGVEGNVQLGKARPPYWCKSRGVWASKNPAQRACSCSSAAPVTPCSQCQM